jgi:hypothetical protein
MRLKVLLICGYERNFYQLNIQFYIKEISSPHSDNKTLYMKSYFSHMSLDSMFVPSKKIDKLNQQQIYYNTKTALLKCKTNIALGLSKSKGEGEEELSEF